MYLILGFHTIKGHKMEFLDVQNEKLFADLFGIKYKVKEKKIIHFRVHLGVILLQITLN